MLHFLVARLWWLAMRTVTYDFAILSQPPALALLVRQLVGGKGVLQQSLIMAAPIGKCF